MNSLSLLIYLPCQQVNELDVQIKSVHDLNLPDASSISYTNEPKTLPKLDRDFPTLVDRDAQLDALSSMAAGLHAKMEHIKTAGVHMSGAKPKYDEDRMMFEFRFLIVN